MAWLVLVGLVVEAVLVGGAWLLGASRQSVVLPSPAAEAEIVQLRRELAEARAREGELLVALSAVPSGSDRR